MGYGSSSRGGCYVAVEEHYESCGGGDDVIRMEENILSLALGR